MTAAYQAFRASAGKRREWEQRQREQERALQALEGRRTASRGTRRQTPRDIRPSQEQQQAVGEVVDAVLGPADRMFEDMAQAPVYSPGGVAGRVGDFLLGDMPTDAERAAVGDEDVYWQDTEPEMVQTRGGMAQRGSVSMPTAAGVELAALAADATPLALTKARHFAEDAARLPGRIVDDYVARQAGAMPAISAPLGGRAQLGMLGTRLPRSSDTLDEMTAAAGYQVGTSPGIYTYPQGVESTSRAARLAPPDAQRVREYQARMTEEYGAPTAEKLAAMARADAVKYRSEHHPSEGWAPAEIGRVDTGDSGPSITYKGAHPNFHIDPTTDRPYKGARRTAAVENASNALVDEVADIITRAGAGDANAQFIVDQSKWYNDAQRTIRDAFGDTGGSLYADLQGAMSPNTKLRDQHKMAQEFFERLVGGEFDDHLQRFDAHMARKPDGETDSQWARRLFDERAEEYDPAAVPLKRNGKKFGMHSASAMLSARRLLGNVEPGMAPKMRNFAQNLRGTSVDPTIDVWAGRTVNRLMGGDRVPPKADAGVPGQRAQPTYTLRSGHYDRALSQRNRELRAFERGKAPPSPSMGAAKDAEQIPAPEVTAQYGLARDVFNTAAAKLGMDADDLQALMWFAEKELWERKGWTPIDDQPSLVELIRRDNPPGARTRELRALADQYGRSIP